VASCLHKLQLSDWWSGVAFWYPLHPPFETKHAEYHKAAEHIMSLLFFYSLVEYLFLAWQLTFPLWAWRRGRFFRLLLVGGGVIGFLGCVWIYQMPAVGAFYLVGSLAFLTADEWHRLAAPLAKVWQSDSSIKTAKPSQSRAPVVVQAS
jgi:hypothetical protein